MSGNIVLSGNSEDFQALATAYDDYKKSELLLKYVSGEASIAASTQVNYAFHHLVEALSKSKDELKKEEFGKVRVHLKRAEMDNIEAALLHLKVSLNKTLQSKFTSEKVRNIAVRLNSEFTEAYNLVREDPDHVSGNIATGKMIKELDQIEALKYESNALAAREKRNAVFKSYIFMAIAIGFGIAANLIFQLLKNWL